MCYDLELSDGSAAAKPFPQNPQGAVNRKKKSKVNLLEISARLNAFWLRFGAPASSECSASTGRHRSRPSLRFIFSSKRCKNEFWLWNVSAALNIRKDGF